MLDRLLLIFLGLWIFPPNAHAQQLTDCRNPCERTRTIRYGAFIGVRIVDSSFARQVHVVEVIPQSAAQTFGVRMGDIITHLNGIELLSTAQLLSEVAKWQPGDEVSLHLLRNGKVIELSFPLGAQFSKTITEMVCCDEDPETGTFDFSLSMSPAQERLMIHSATILKEPVQVDLLNEQGLVLASERRAGSGEKFQMSLETGHLPRGSYMIRIRLGTQRYVKRFNLGPEQGN